ncbi:MAG TPA: hypothetical protein K8W01_14715 [Methylorubrum populi]|uniref:Uncharacterized protein n=1 Tax=Methylorubrum populi TaxID=223967 RepID=A0A921JFI0_9HYPH|nr:hypothetical protein [Methylorubrum populi]
MAVIVKQSTFLQVDNAPDCINYLQSVYNSQWDPFTIHTDVRLTSRLGVPADVAAYEVGLFSFGKINHPIVGLLSLTSDGLFTVMSVPKANIIRR